MLKFLIKSDHSVTEAECLLVLIVTFLKTTMVNIYESHIEYSTTLTHTHS